MDYMTLKESSEKWEKPVDRRYRNCRSNAPRKDSKNEILPDVIILNVMLPDIGGYEVCKRIRQFSHCPILFLSSKNDEMDKILGLA